MKKEIIAGEKYGRWLVLEWSKGTNHVRCLCVCECGSFQRVQAHHLKNGLSNGCRACGVVRHGMSRSSTMGSWRAMHDRCERYGNASYSKYGGRGIGVCEEWGDFKVFLRDMGEKPTGHSIERIDGKLGYGPENCVWASIFAQNNNRSCNRIVSYKGAEYKLANLARHLNMNPKTLWHCVVAGTDLDAPIKRKFPAVNQSMSGSEMQ